MVRARSSNPPASILEETLDSVVFRAARDAMIGAALSEFGATAIPTDPEEFRSFVRGPLRRALAHGLGDALAATVLSELEITRQSKPPTVRPAAKRARRSSSAPLASSPPGRTGAPPRLPRAPALPSMQPGGSPARSGFPRGPTAPPVSGPVQHQPRPGAVLSAEFPAIGGLAAPSTLVFALTNDRRTAGSLEAWLGCRVPVIMVADFTMLVRGIAAASSPLLIVIDCHAPSVRPLAVAAIEADLPCPARFVLWGATAEDDDALAAVNPATREWTRCVGPEPSDLAAVCADLVS